MTRSPPVAILMGDDPLALDLIALLDEPWTVFHCHRAEELLSLLAVHPPMPVIIDLGFLLENRAPEKNLWKIVDGQRQRGTATVLLADRESVAFARSLAPSAILFLLSKPPAVGSLVAAIGGGEAGESHGPALDGVSPQFP